MWCTHYTRQFCFHVCLPVCSLCLMSKCMCHWNETMFSTDLYFFSSFFFFFLFPFIFAFFLETKSTSKKSVCSVVDLTIAIHPIGNKTSDHHSHCGSKKQPTKKILKITAKKKKIQQPTPNPSFYSGLWYIGIQWMTLYLKTHFAWFSF